MARQYTRNELKVLWSLKRGPWTKQDKISLLKKQAGILDMRPATLAYVLKGLELESLVLRHYEKGRTSDWAKGEYNPLVKVELVDPTMWLPELPPPLPLGIVMDQENRDLHERTCETPTEERVIEMLLIRNDELQAQVNKLQEVIEGLAAENSKLAFQVEKLSRPARRRVSDHLSSRVQNALTPEQWDQLRRPKND
jgi:hypothetical protein